jgi:hypothetical protein
VISPPGQPPAKTADEFFGLRRSALNIDLAASVNFVRNPGVFALPFVDLLARGTAQWNRQAIQRVEHDCFGAKTRKNWLSKYWATNQDIEHGLIL